MKKNQPYTPINCDLYDFLEIFALQKKMVKITFLDHGQPKIVEDRIRTVKALNSEEHLYLESGISIRLDMLLQIDEINFRESSC